VGNARCRDGARSAGVDAHSWSRVLATRHRCPRSVHAAERHNHADSDSFVNRHALALGTSNLCVPGPSTPAQNRAVVVGTCRRILPLPDIPSEAGSGFRTAALIRRRRGHSAVRAFLCLCPAVVVPSRAAMAWLSRSRSAFSSVRIVSSVKGSSSHCGVKLTYARLSSRLSFWSGLLSCWRGGVAGALVLTHVLSRLPGHQGRSHGDCEI